ncbi:serine recombinase [Mycobacterium colombiense]
MNSPIDRMWAVRDALLFWLYSSAAVGNRLPTIDLEEIQELAGWTAEPLLADEVAAATTFLKEEGYIAGESSWGGMVLRPRITALGERKAAEGTSVRPGPARPANPTGNTFNVHNYGTGNFNVGGHVESQQLWSQTNAGPVLEVADALDRFAAGHADGASAKELATEIRGEIQTGNPIGSKLHALLATAIGTVAAAAGTELGKQVTDAAVNALQILG